MNPISTDLLQNRFSSLHSPFPCSRPFSARLSSRHLGNLSVGHEQKRRLFPIGKLHRVPLCLPLKQADWIDVFPRSLDSTYLVVRHKSPRSTTPGFPMGAGPITGSVQSDTESGGASCKTPDIHGLEKLVGFRKTTKGTGSRPYHPAWSLVTHSTISLYCRELILLSEPHSTLANSVF